MLSGAEPAGQPGRVVLFAYKTNDQLRSERSTEGVDGAASAVDMPKHIRD